MEENERKRLVELTQDFENLQIKSVIKTCGLLNILEFSSCEHEFEIHLTPSYPHTPPRVLCTTVSTFPVCADGRDLLRYILPWSKNTKLDSIIKAIPDFFSKYKITEDIGEFQLLSLIPFSTWSNKSSMLWFFCSEIDALNSSTRKPRVIVLTHSYFLLLEPCRSCEAGVVLFWASLHSISSVQISRFDDQEIVINWNTALGNNLQIFRSKQVRRFCQLLSSNLAKLGSVVQQTFLVDLEESCDKFKIFDILRKIERNERLLETLVDHEKVTSLIALYQKAVEYFSAEEDLRYEIYLNKLQNLFTDKRVFSQVFSEIRPQTTRRSRVKSMEVPLPKNWMHDNLSRSATENYVKDFE
jgi:hypothetical protein